MRLQKHHGNMQEDNMENGKPMDNMTYPTSVFKPDCCFGAPDAPGAADGRVTCEAGAAGRGDLRGDAGGRDEDLVH